MDDLNDTIKNLMNETNKISMDDNVDLNVILNLRIILSEAFKLNKMVKSLIEKTDKSNDFYRSTVKLKESLEGFLESRDKLVQRTMGIDENSVLYRNTL